MTTTLERPVAKLRVYGSEISNVTGHRREVGKRTGTTQMPAVELPDGRWMTDTTPMIA